MAEWFKVLDLKSITFIRRGFEPHYSFKKMYTLKNTFAKIFVAQQKKKKIVVIRKNNIAKHFLDLL
jgi:hypothetical protein